MQIQFIKLLQLVHSWFCDSDFVAFFMNTVITSREGPSETHQAHSLIINSYEQRKNLIKPR